MSCRIVLAQVGTHDVGLGCPIAGNWYSGGTGRTSSYQPAAWATERPGATVTVISRAVGKCRSAHASLAAIRVPNRPLFQGPQAAAVRSCDEAPTGSNKVAIARVTKCRTLMGPS